MQGLLLSISSLPGPCQWPTPSTSGGMSQWCPHCATFLVYNHRTAFLQNNSHEILVWQDVTWLQHNSDSMVRHTITRSPHSGLVMHMRRPAGKKRVEVGTSQVISETLSPGRPITILRNQCLEEDRPQSGMLPRVISDSRLVLSALSVKPANSFFLHAVSLRSMMPT